ncbi:non-homologous end-joining DNA ligase LigD [Methylobacterium thuringiense]|uniref:non-homologous end-joining DNA ligase LigD n=1 Tax=Methylobacterium thuringiense TaxID=1003091 RepID=UPI0035716EC2
MFVDYLRNHRGATAFASFSTRARTGAPVLVPVIWDQLPAPGSGGRFTVDTLVSRLRAVRRTPRAGFADAAHPLEHVPVVQRRSFSTTRRSGCTSFRIRCRWGRKSSSRVMAAAGTVRQEARPNEKARRPNCLGTRDRGTGACAGYSFE